jgi:hypothetical protein
MNMNLNLKDKRNAQWVALALFILTLLTRLPFQSQYLYHWDSVNMAFGIQEFNVTEEAPQYPGYIVYIALAQIINLLFGNPQQTMVVISMVSSGMAVAGLFYLGREIFNPITGLIAALLLLSSPLFWFYGEIALPHTLDMAAVIISVWLLYKIKAGETGLIWVTVILLALIGGFRQQTLLFLAPVALFSCYRIGVVRLVKAALLGLVVTLAWFIPLMIYSGGLQSYMAGSNAYSARFFNSTSIMAGAGTFGLARNIINKLIPYTLYGWSLGIIPAVAYVLWRLPGRWRAWLRNHKVWFILIWIAPSLLFYALIHMGQQGLTFVFLPALLLVSAHALYKLFERRPALLRASAAAITLLSAGVFIFMPTYPLGADGSKILTYDTLRESDQIMADRIALVRQNFDPETTLLVAESWRHIQYYLPEYQFARFSLGSRFELDEGEPSDADFVNQPMTREQLGLTPGEDWQVVVIDADLASFANSPLESVQLPDGFQINYLPMGQDDAYWTDGLTFGLTQSNTAGNG